MVDLLFSHIGRFIPVSKNLRNRLEKISTIREVEKNTYLHKPGTVCDSTYFINSGLLRTYYEKDERQITENFASEGEWITSIFSFLSNIPDNHFIQALENTQLISIRFEDLEKCFHDFNEMNTFGRMLMSKLYMEQSERMITFQFQSAKERYAYFLQTSADKINRVPLGMLASYLGMTQETLSRIRSERAF